MNCLVDYDETSIHHDLVKQQQRNSVSSQRCVGRKAKNKYNTKTVLPTRVETNCEARRSGKSILMYGTEDVEKKGADWNSKVEVMDIGKDGASKILKKPIEKRKTKKNWGLISLFTNNSDYNV